MNIRIIGLPDNIDFVQISGQIPTLITGSRSPVWFFGASRLGNQTFDLQNLSDAQ
jgi:hypothetical protein